MGLFSWLFKRKKKDEAIAQEPQRHFCEERPERYKATKSSTNNLAENQITIDEVIVESSVAEEESADKIVSDKNTKSVKVKGFKGAFDIKRSKDGRYVFNLFAANKMIVATSRVYSSAQNALSGINSVITNAERANVEDQSLKQFTAQPFPKWEIYIDK